MMISDWKQVKTGALCGVFSLAHRSSMAMASSRIMASRGRSHTARSINWSFRDGSCRERKRKREETTRVQWINDTDILLVSGQRIHCLHLDINVLVAPGTWEYTCSTTTIWHVFHYYNMTCTMSCTLDMYIMTRVPLLHWHVQYDIVHMTCTVIMAIRQWQVQCQTESDGGQDGVASSIDSNEPVKYIETTTWWMDIASIACTD